MISISLVWYLLVFAANTSGMLLPPQGEELTIEFKSEAQIAEDAGLMAYAYTEVATGTIVLPNTFDQNNVDHKCALAHELTHYLQIVNHKLPAKPEPIAYYVGALCYKKLYHDLHGFEWSMGQAIARLRN